MICNISTAGLAPAFIFFKTDMGRNMHSKDYNLDPLVKFSDLIPSFSNFWVWVKETFTPQYRDEIEAYLANSTDVFDLERKIVYLSRRGMI